MISTSIDAHDLIFESDHSPTIRDLLVSYGLILAAFVENDHVRLALDQEAAVDLSIIQLIESARRHAEIQGKTIRLARPIGANVRRVLERVGFLSHSAPDASGFWLHGETVW
jgi:hypothetical protein